MKWIGMFHAAEADLLSVFQWLLDVFQLIAKWNSFSFLARRRRALQIGLELNRFFIFSWSRFWYAFYVVVGLCFLDISMLKHTNYNNLNISMIKSIELWIWWKTNNIWFAFWHNANKNHQTTTTITDWLIPVAAMAGHIYSRSTVTTFTKMVNYPAHPSVIPAPVHHTLFYPALYASLRYRCAVSLFAVPASDRRPSAVMHIRWKTWPGMTMAPLPFAWMLWRVAAVVIPAGIFIPLCICRHN